MAYRETMSEFNANATVVLNQNADGNSTGSLTALSIALDLKWSPNISLIMYSGSFGVGS